MFVRRERLKKTNFLKTYLLTYNHNILIAYGYAIMIKKVFVESFVCFYDIYHTQQTVIFCFERFRVYPYLNIIMLFYRSMFFFTMINLVIKLLTSHTLSFTRITHKCDRLYNYYVFSEDDFFYEDFNENIVYRLFEKGAFSFDVVTC